MGIQQPKLGEGGKQRLNRSGVANIVFCYHRKHFTVDELCKNRVTIAVLYYWKYLWREGSPSASCSASSDCTYE